MKNSRRISNKIEKKYKRPIDNLYSYRFYEDLFTNYAYSLSEKKFDRSDFFMIVSDDNAYTYPTKFDCNVGVDIHLI